MSILPTAFPAERPKGELPVWASLAAILAVAAVLRFYSLEVPELLHDEALVACAASHDPGYIFRRALHADAHPPYFYFLAKAFLLAGQSEAALRLVSALAGVGAVLALYRLGRRVAGQATGLFASALLAGHLLHVELSRVLRPHSLTILLAILAAGFFLDMLEKRDRPSLVRLMLVNLALAFLHFNTLLVLGAQMAVAGILLLGGMLRPWRYGLAFLGMCAAVLPVNLWFALLRLGEFSGVDTNATMAWTATRSLTNLNSLLTLAPLPLAQVAGWLLAAAGFAALFKRDTRAGFVLTGFTLLPILTLVAARYGIIYEPWHVAFLLPFLLLACGRALSLLPLPAGWCAPALALLLGVVLFARKQADLYGPTAPMFNHGLGQRAVARALPPLMDQSTVVAFADRPLSDFTNWYLRQCSTRDLTAFTMGSAVPDAGITLVSPPLPLPPEAHGARLAQALGVPTSTEPAGRLALNHWRVPRDPIIMTESLPARINLPADLEKVVAQANTLQDIAPVLSPLHDGLAPSRYDTPATLTYRIENRSGRKATGFSMRLGAGSVRPENILAVTYCLDGGPPRMLFSQVGIVPSAEVTALAKEPAGFDTLDVTVTMTCSSAVPSFNNIPDSMVYNGMELVLEGDDEAFSHNVPAVEAGLQAPEANGQNRYRWGTGPESQLFFVPDSPGDYALHLEGSSPLPGQVIEVLLDDSPIGRMNLPEADQPATATLCFSALPGNRLLTLRYARFNHGPGGAFAPDDGRRLAVAYSKLSLRAAHPRPSKLVSVENK